MERLEYETTIDCQRGMDVADEVAIVTDDEDDGEDTYAEHMRYETAAWRFV